MRLLLGDVRRNESRHRSRRTGAEVKLPRTYTLRPLMSMVSVDSLANGKLLVDPRWRKKIGKPGLMTRLAAAQRLERLINDYLKGRG